MKEVQIDRDECIGCGACVELCLEIFAFNDDENKACVIQPEGGNKDLQRGHSLLTSRLHYEPIAT